MKSLNISMESLFIISLIYALICICISQFLIYKERCNELIEENINASLLLDEMDFRIEELEYYAMNENERRNYNNSIAMEYYNLN